MHYQIIDVGGWLQPGVRGFGLDAPSSSGAGTVGDRIAQEEAQRIHDRGMRGEGPDGAWEDNAESTIERKGRK